MKTSAIVCAVLAGTLGFGSLAQAQDWRGRDHDRGQRAEQRHDRRDDRRDHRWEGRRDNRHDNRWDGRRDNRWDGRRGPDVGHYQPGSRWQHPHAVYQQPRYGHRFYRGGYLPNEYRGRGYYVNNWQAYPGLYAPAYGQQWVNVDGQFLLVALATGLIANALLN